MKFLFTSDSFRYIHPELLPKEQNEYTADEIKDAMSNTDKIKYNIALLYSAIVSSSNSIPKSQIGSLIVLPYSVNGDNPTELSQSILKKFVSDIFKTTIDKLCSEYSDKSDPTNFYSIDNNGRYFNAYFNNTKKKAKEMFTPKSISIYIAGCKSMTAEYLFEEFINNCYVEYGKAHRKTVHSPSDGTKSGYDGKLINFDKFRSFLVYDFNLKRFHQIGTKENELYFRKKRKYKISQSYSPIESSPSFNMDDESFD